MERDPGAVPVHVLSGFLGVGKTTAVRDLLARHAGRERIAVVVNEYGDLGIDGALLSDCTSCVLKEVPGGCVCCTALADLEASLEEMLDIVAPTRIVIEPTGLARPSEIVDLLRRERFAGRLEVRPVITLVDPTRDFASSYADEALFRDQVDLGDILVFNRRDLATDDQIAAAEAWARALVPPKVAVLTTSHGVLPDDVLTMTVPDSRTLARLEAALPSLLPVRGSRHATAGDDGYAGHGTAWGPERVFDAERLDAFFSALAGRSLALAGEIARAKGIFRTTAGWQVREWAGGVLSRGVTAYRRDSRFDVILRSRGADDFAKVDAVLEDALVPEGAPLVAVEHGTELLRAFDARALAALSGTGGASVPVARLLELAGAPRDPEWLWVVSDGGLFGAGAPRALAEQGVVTVDEAGELRFLVPDALADEHEAELDACRDVPGVCALRLADPPGEPS